MILFHNTAGVNMLPGFVIGLLSLLSGRPNFIELATQLKGVICLESSPIDQCLTRGRAPDTIAPLCTNLIGNATACPHVQDPGNSIVFEAPVTIILDDGNTQDRYIWSALSPHLKLSMMFCPLDAKVHSPSFLQSDKELNEH